MSHLSMSGATGRARRLILVLAIALGVAVTIPAPANAASTSFPDVPPSHTFYEHITWLASQGITSGYGNGTFGPSDEVTRGQMAAFLYKVAGSPAFTPPTGSPFKDVPKSHTFYKHITWLAETGITSGVGDGSRFAPDDEVSRGQMAVFLYKVYGAPAFKVPGTSPFKDVPKSHTFYKHVTWLASSGVTSGVGDGSRFDPSGEVTRGQMAAFLLKMYFELPPYVGATVLPPAADGYCPLVLTFYNPDKAWDGVGFAWEVTYDDGGDDTLLFIFKSDQRPWPFFTEVLVEEGAPLWPGDAIVSSRAEIGFEGERYQVDVVLGDRMSCPA
ncbi:S-layer homology domain-containing protein [Demequina activiva]|nr:S-layer homology domain-containing protein [Demequina activiva]